MAKPEKILVVDDDLEDQELLLEAINELYPGSDNIAKKRWSGSIGLYCPKPSTAIHNFFGPQYAPGKWV